MMSSKSFRLFIALSLILVVCMLAAPLMTARAQDDDGLAPLPDVKGLGFILIDTPLYYAPNPYTLVGGPRLTAGQTWFMVGAATGTDGRLWYKVYTASPNYAWVPAAIVQIRQGTVPGETVTTTTTQTGQTVQTGVTTVVVPVPVIVTPIPKPTGNVGIVSTGALNVRTGPGVEYASMAIVHAGDFLAVTGKHPSLPWMRVEGSFGVGWVRIMYMTFRGNWDTVPQVTEPVGAFVTSVAVTGIDRTVYNAPTGLPVGTIPAGTYVVVGRTDDWTWMLIATPLGNAWISSAEALFRGVAELIPVVP